MPAFSQDTWATACNYAKKKPLNTKLPNVRKLAVNGDRRRLSSDKDANFRN